MEAIKRKRVTRVGSGAWSIYLPKKWIDSWTPDQQRDREVDLHLVSGSLLIVPVGQDRTFKATAPDDTAALRTLLLSAYVRGYDHVELRPVDRFPNQAIAAARDLLRLLDERLVATVGPDRIAFTMPPGATAPAADLLQTMGARVGETLALAHECVDQAAHDPERVLHAARLLHSIQSEDVSRFLHQTLRKVATLDLPLGSVTDFQLLDGAAYLLDGMGADALAVAETVLADLGLGIKDLAYPHDETVARLPKRNVLPPVARDILHGHRTALRDAQDLLARLLAALASAEPTALRDAANDAKAAREALQERLFEAVLRHWGDQASRTDAARGFAAYQTNAPIANLLVGIESLASQALLLLAARRAVNATEPKAGRAR